MTNPNEDLVRDLYAAFSAGDADGMRRVFDPNVRWHQPGRSVLAGDHVGVDAVFAFFGKVAEVSAGTFAVELHDVVAGPEHTVALHTGRGQAHGVNLEDHNVLVIDCEDGRVREVWEHHENLYNVDAFWGGASDA